MKLQNLNFRHLFYFWSIAKEGHLTRVADTLRVSQSALSVQVKQLEEALGATLFTRERRLLKLTEVGRVVLNYADNIFALGGELLASLAAGEGQKVQQLSVGAVATLSRNFQENFLKPLFTANDVRLVVESGSLEELLQRLSVHRLHLVLSNRAVSAGPEFPWRCRRIARQPVCLIGKPLNQSRRFKFPDDIAGQRLLLPGRSSDIRTAFDLLCEDLSIKVEIFAEVDDMAMLRLLARDSGAITLAPTVVVQDELRSNILQEYCVVPKVYENFYAITTERRFHPEPLKQLLAVK